MYVYVIKASPVLLDLRCLSVKLCEIHVAESFVMCKSANNELICGKSARANQYTCSDYLKILIIITDNLQSI